MKIPGTLDFLPCYLMNCVDTQFYDFMLLTIMHEIKVVIDDIPLVCIYPNEIINFDYIAINKCVLWVAHDSFRVTLSP